MMVAPNEISTLAMLLPAILAVIFGMVLPVVLTVLLIRALLKYLRSDTGRHSPPAQAQSLGEALKAHRTSRDLTQEYVAEALGVSRQAVSKWENGASDPSTVNLMPWPSFAACRWTSCWAR